ncbi:zinc-binding dehydrogenase [Lentzea sp. E54]|uniref:zinc-binding dehydrogenase n=1 Tax=Lentzea xerophila TaxID=3435883 RepID=UPI003DA6C462
MRAAILHGAGHVTVEDVADPVVVDPADAVVRVLVAGICGTDLHGYRGLPGPVTGPRCGHEFIGVVTEVGKDVRTARPGTVVVAPFSFSDGVCDSCTRGFSSSCAVGGMFGVAGDGGQAEAVRVPFADSTLVAVPVEADDERLPALLTLTDVMATGTHAVRSAGVRPSDVVAVVGDGSVGLCTVLAARAAGVERVMLLGRHESRTHIGKLFGATDVLTGRDLGAAAEFVREHTGGVGADVVVECTAAPPSQELALSICRDGGAVSVTGGPPVADLSATFLRNVRLTGGLTPARTYLPELVEDVLAGRIDPSPVFDRTLPLEQIADGYAAMDARTATKVLVRVHQD